MSYTITSDNYSEAEAAIRDILFMYRDLIRSYKGFGHGIDRGTFDYFAFVDAELCEETGSSLAMDMNLIHQGSAVALLCTLSDIWDETDGHELKKWEWSKKLLAALDEGRLNHGPSSKSGFHSWIRVRRKTALTPA